MVSDLGGDYGGIVKVVCCFWLGRKFKKPSVLGELVVFVAPSFGVKLILQI